MLRHLTLILTLCTALCSLASDYEALAVKARRMFHYREWASAGALYSLMLAERPQVTDSYGHAIVAAGMIDDPAQQLRLTDMGLRSQVPVDSLFRSVERTSFSVGQTSLYEKYLLLVKQAEPWLARSIDSYLLKYYVYRRDAAGMIEYSRIMLGPVPDRKEFLYTLAQGYLLDGQTDNAIGIYTRIVELYPQSLEALLYLGNYYSSYASSDTQARAQALTYLRRARDIAATPYLEATIARLEAIH